jgi:hypothetical protein
LRTSSIIPGGMFPFDSPSLPRLCDCSEYDTPSSISASIVIRV